MGIDTRRWRPITKVATSLAGPKGSWSAETDQEHIKTFIAWLLTRLDLDLYAEFIVIYTLILHSPFLCAVFFKNMK